MWVPARTCACVYVTVCARSNEHVLKITCKSFVNPFDVPSRVVMFLCVSDLRDLGPVSWRPTTVK